MERNRWLSKRDTNVERCYSGASVKQRPESTGAVTIRGWSMTPSYRSLYDKDLLSFALHVGYGEPLRSAKIGGFLDVIRPRCK